MEKVSKIVVKTIFLNLKILIIVINLGFSFYYQFYRKLLQKIGKMPIKHVIFIQHNKKKGGAII